ncbi:MAG: hypothetical protein COB98_01300 [Flavobacteriaceae bacterium]|nr:MAG: hypothetical protein COB98_01300 [Flavobacteriaceae bacterium]
MKIRFIVYVLVLLFIGCNKSNREDPILNSCNVHDLGITTKWKTQAPGSDYCMCIWQWKKSQDTLFLKSSSPEGMKDNDPEKEYSLDRILVFLIEDDCPVLIRHFDDYNNQSPFSPVNHPDAVDGIVEWPVNLEIQKWECDKIIVGKSVNLQDGFDDYYIGATFWVEFTEELRYE